jgi:hypothetical protein
VFTGEWSCQAGSFERTWSVLYSGFIAASESLGDTKYRDAMAGMGKKFDWQVGVVG